MPLSHFGTQTAANMRLMHFMYKALGLQEPAVLSLQALGPLMKKYAQRKNLPKLSIHSVYLTIKSPVRMPDLALHSLEQYYNWFLRKYIPKSHYLTGVERCEGDVVGPARIGYKKLLSDFIFRDPFIQSEENLVRELSAESFYSIPEKEKKFKTIPAFLFPVAQKMDKNLYPLAERVAFQRMMRYLEGEGHDGFVYQNEHEDKGKDSYIIFRPEQVFDSSDKTMEHLVPEKTLEQLTFLSDTESEFFKRCGMVSPSQRIQNHSQNLKKNKVRQS